MACLKSYSGLTIVTCGRRAPAAEFPHYSWSFGENSPIPGIIGDYPDNPIIVLYSAIHWPTCGDDINVNLSALCSVENSLPAGSKFISMSSLVVNTRSDTWYAKLKRKEELFCREHSLVSMRLGLIDSNRPFGQSNMFLSLANFLHVVPIPFPSAKVILSSENEICKRLNQYIFDDNNLLPSVVDICSNKLSFIDAVRYILHKHNAKAICVPVPKFITHICVYICAKHFPDSWFSERLRGLQAFSD